MTLTLEQRALAQSDQEDIVVLGPMPANFSLQENLAGKFTILGVRPGLTVSVFDLEVGADFPRALSTKPCVAINLLFFATGQGWLLDGVGRKRVSVPYRPGRFYLMSAPDGANGYYDVPQGSRFKGVDVRVSLDLWARLGGAKPVEELSGTHPLHAGSYGNTWMGILPLSPQVSTAARSLFDSGMKGGGDLNLEARSLDIIAASIAALQNPLSSSGSSGFYRRALQRAHDLLLSDLAHPWTISELAQRSGVSEKRLKEGFRAMFGLPVYGYLQEARLNEAKCLLAQQISVTEVALRIGYSSVSHFSSIFSRRFGVQPSKFDGY